MSQQYQIAGKILGDVMKKKAGIKSLLYSSKIGQKKSIYALVCETIKYKAIIEKIIEIAGIKTDLDGIREQNVLYVLIYELLFGKKKIQGGGKVKRQIMEVSPQLQAALEQLKVERGGILLAEEPRQLAKEIPRYARVNPLKIEPEAAFMQLKDEGFGCTWDPVIKNLLVVPRAATSDPNGTSQKIDTSLHAHPLVKNGSLILQDKASCFPAQALADAGWQEGDAIDACAAPGNKTTQLAALAALSPQQRRIFAFDKSPERLKVLKRRVGEAGASGIVIPLLQDFLEVPTNREDLTKVKAILLDPSCSGSGMINCPGRLNEQGDGDEDQRRIAKLASFQLAALQKAFSFPQVEFVVYSTCSIHEAENEEVVSKALAAQRTDLEQNVEAASGRSFGLVKCLENWPRRGKQVAGLTLEESQKLARAHPEDGTNGFFVALFQKSKKEENERNKPNKLKRKSRQVVLCNSSNAHERKNNPFAILDESEADESDIETHQGSGKNTPEQSILQTLGEPTKPPKILTGKQLRRKKKKYRLKLNQKRRKIENSV